MPCKIKKKYSFGATNLVEISALESEYASSEPGLMVISTVAKLKKKKTISIDDCK
jgi:hypothetical protein